MENRRVLEDAFDRAEIIVMGALKIVEKILIRDIPYKWGGKDYGGFDCSGLIEYCYQPLIHRGTQKQWEQLKQFSIPPVISQPGDLLFFFNDSKYEHAYHVCFIKECHLNGMEVIHSSRWDEVIEEAIYKKSFMEQGLLDVERCRVVNIKRFYFDFLIKKSIREEFKL